MAFGRGPSDFYLNDKRGVAQCVQTRLGEYVGDWFLDTSAGTPWRTEVLGRRTNATRDPAIRARILGTQGVTGIADFASQLSRGTRGYTVQAKIDTAYGQTLVATPDNTLNVDVRQGR